ncbi:hypothetical protein RYX36_030682 [Vicia faba]
MGSRRETASFALGLVSVIVWVVAEIPQIITNYKAKSTDGLSLTFLITWIIGDLFNLFGCILEPATVSVSLINTEYLVSLALNISESSSYTHLCFEFIRSARSLTKTHTPTSGSILAQRMTPNSPFMDSMKENLLGSAFARQSAPSLKIKSTLCLVSTLSFFGVINLYKSLDKGINPMVSNPRQQFVVYVGRKLFQVSGNQLLENGASGNNSIGTFLGWAMTFLYLSGRMPQIWLNIRRGHAEVRGSNY